MTIGMIASHRRNTGRHNFTPNPHNTALVDTAKRGAIPPIAGKFTTLRKESPREWSGPCPKCGGDDRFHCTDEWWFCRECHAKRSDVIEFVQWSMGMDFKAAVGFLAGGMMVATPVVQQRTERPKQAATQTAAWTDEATREAEVAHRRLLDDYNGAHMQYLLKRGFDIDCALAYHLGAGHAWNRESRQDEPAIVIPWYRAGAVRALRYRFIAPAGKQKTTSKPGSQFAGALYGGQALKGGAEHRRTLVVCEGELNAISIWRVAYSGGVDVLSLGSESQALTDAMVQHAAKFQHVIVWMDKPEVVDALRQKLPGALGFASPEGKDANDMLRLGMLQATIAELRRRACEDDAQRESLLWDLHDQHLLYGGVDAPTQAIIAELATGLGKVVAL